MEVTFMEPQEYSYCCEAKKKCKRTNCLGIIAIILGILFAGIIGVIIGAALAETILTALAAIIVLAITFFVNVSPSVVFLHKAKSSGFSFFSSDNNFFCSFNTNYNIATL
jgi:uncharacterized protein YacL